LGRNYAGVHKYAEKQGLKFSRRPRRESAPTLQDILALAPQPLARNDPGLKGRGRGRAGVKDTPATRSAS